MDDSTRYSPPSLDQHEDLLVGLKSNGVTHHNIQKELRRKHVYVSVSTIKRFFRSLPRERFEHKSSESRLVQDALERIKDRREKTNDTKQAAYWIRHGLALGSPRHHNYSDGKIHSLGTARNYQQSLSMFYRWLQNRKLGDLSTATAGQAVDWLNKRSVQVSQKTLDLNRQAIQYLMTQTTGDRVKFDRIKSTYTTGRKLAEEARAYSGVQLEEVCARLSARSALSAKLCFAAGLRAHEVVTLRPIGEQPPSTHREWSKELFKGREGALYTVVGKGGLRRAVLLPAQLADELEGRRIKDRTVRDRGIRYVQRHDVNFGRNLTKAWSDASSKALGRSAGLHGLRHSYAKQRLYELQQLGYSRAERMSIVSQELGHFRTTETETYLR